jgi:hypothetical protein
MGWLVSTNKMFHIKDLEKKVSGARGPTFRITLAGAAIGHRRVYRAGRAIWAHSGAILRRDFEVSCGNVKLHRAIC